MVTDERFSLNKVYGLLYPRLQALKITFPKGADKCGSVSHSVFPLFLTHLFDLQIISSVEVYPFIAHIVVPCAKPNPTAEILGHLAVGISKKYMMFVKAKRSAAPKAHLLIT